MKRSILFQAAVCALLVPMLGCDLLKVSDSESTGGRGAKVFDPYQSAASGAIRLSLQMFNGCAILPNGQMAAKNSATFFPYPDKCPSLASPLDEPTKTLVDPTGRIQIQANTTYFLNQFTVTDTVVDKHTTPGDLSAAISWMKNESVFKKLDWSNLSQVSDEWKFLPAVPGATHDSWARQVLFDNANWRTATDDSFTIEILDFDGVVRGEPVTYARSEFLADSWSAGHSRIMWRMEKVMPPVAPGDQVARPIPQVPGWPPEPPLFRTMVRMDAIGSTNPFKTFKVGDLRGDGTIKITWSQMKDSPFYFPVTYVNPQDVPATCTDDSGNAKPCGFGLAPRLTMAAPVNGLDYYQPGELLDLFVDVRDGEGNRLHPADTLPSGAEVSSNNANGLLYALIPLLDTVMDYDMVPAVQIAGPLQDMRVRSDPTAPAQYFGPDFFYALADEPATVHLPTGMNTMKWPTRISKTLPKDAKAGTYVALVKNNRYFMGERTSKLNAFFFQVGQSERTSYPGDVGNCQICHRGVLSLDNLRHGLSVDHVESCKVCHMFNNDLYNRPQEFIHKIHMTSSRYPANKSDCTMCHLTKRSTLRPSITLCASCHPSAHDNQFFQAKFSSTGEPNRFGNCAQACHVNTPPKSHILPSTEGL
ncbi:hypothetical protein [Hyalangium versicolor]|uniref:hypothetical protein n=1 Tax=Hyalangium versicolor TaxID=2861190 RepID=UPI001CCFFBC6|nr:hypothetical protein [Hyalangium versicolor]